MFWLLIFSNFSLAWKVSGKYLFAYLAILLIDFANYYDSSTSSLLWTSGSGLGLYFSYSSSDLFLFFILNVISWNFKAYYSSYWGFWCALLGTELAALPDWGFIYTWLTVYEGGWASSCNYYVVGSDTTVFDVFSDCFSLLVGVGGSLFLLFIIWNMMFCLSCCFWSSSYCLLRSYSCMRTPTFALKNCFPSNWGFKLFIIDQMIGELISIISLWTLSKLSLFN